VEDDATIQHEHAVKFDFRTGEAWAMSTLFAVFAAIAIYALDFVRARVPETKGLSLEEIERYFASGERLAGIESPLIPPVGDELVV
jgi:hypothetical protein